MRVGIIAIQHESNTFLPVATTLAHFQADALLTGSAIAGRYGQAHHEVGGFMAGLDKAGIEAVPLLLALATPGGTIDEPTFSELMAMLIEQLDDAGALDGLLVAPHGAGVASPQRDMDGYWLTLVRDRMGSDMPIICTLDPHANVSDRMIAACDATITYRTNPHMDQRAVGLQAADLMARTLEGRIKPTQALVRPAVTISIDRQETAAQPCKVMYDLAGTIRQRPDVLSSSIALGFPYADVEEMGSSFIVVTDNDPAAAGQHAQELADYLWDNRDDFACHLTDIDAAVGDVAATGQRICLLDMGDNVGGGSPGDGTILAHALGRAKIENTFVCLYDPAAAQQARAAGQGANVELHMGGKTDDKHGPPLSATVTVQSVHDGYFEEPKPRHGGRTRYDMGPTAIVTGPGQMTIMLISQRVPPFSLEQLLSCGLHPRSFKAIIAKGVNAPIAAYSEVCDRFIRVNTSGVTCADMTLLAYEHRRHPLFPFPD
jgi:microcystin degradation protein MlrC